LKSNIQDLPGNGDFKLPLKPAGGYFQDLLQQDGTDATVHIHSYHNMAKAKTMIAASLLGVFNVGERERKLAYLSTRKETGEFDLYNLTRFFPLNLGVPKS
jgi:hypothetical protein